MFPNSPWTRPCLRSYGVINITPAAQGCDTGPDTATIATVMKCCSVCLWVRVCVYGCMCVFSDTYVRLGLLEDQERQGEVSLGQTDQVFSEQRPGGALFLSLAAVQKGHHPLEDVLHVALRAGLGIERP